MRKYMSKRQRPCDFCRSRKTACRIEGSTPCRACQLHGHECTFIEEPRPRKKPRIDAHDHHDGGSADVGIPIEGHLDVPTTSSDRVASANVSRPPMRHQQELDVGRPISSLEPISAGDASLPDLEMQFLNDLDIAGSDYQFMFQTPRTPNSNHSASCDTPQWMNLQPNANSSDGLLDEPGIEVLGLTGDMDPYLLRRYKTDSNGVFKFKQLAIHSVQQDPIPVQFLVSQPSLFARSRKETGQTGFNEQELKMKLEQVVSPGFGRRLIQLYQQFIAPQYPIFSTQQLPEPESAPSHLLAAIYSITFPFAMYDDQLCIDLAYDDPPYPILSQIINTSLTYELHSPGLAVVQTALLVVARPSSNPLVSDASYRWSMLGVLVAAAVNVGLHLDPSHWTLSQDQISLRRRLSFLIYATDIWLAASLGKPPLINDANWLAASLEPNDYCSCGLSSEAWAGLLELSSLTSVMASTLSNLYSLKAVQELDHKSIPKVVNQLMQELDGKTRSTNRGNGHQPNTGLGWNHVLSLAHHFTVLTIRRAAVRPFLSTSSGVMDVRSDTEYFATQANAVANMQDCVKLFSEFIKCLKTEDATVFWPPWCQNAFSALFFTLLMMIVSSPSAEGAVWFVEPLQTTRKDLRLKANSLPVLRLALLRIDSIFWRGIGNVLNLPWHANAVFGD